MFRTYSDCFRNAALLAVALLPTRLVAVKEINTISTPDIMLSHAVSNVPTKEALDFKGNTVSALHSVTTDVTGLMHHFIIVVGFMVLLASLFQYFRYRENPAATRFAQVSTTFFCGIFLIGVSYLAS